MHCGDVSSWIPRCAACSRTSRLAAAQPEEAAPTAAYWFLSNSWAFADQGISSQSRQTQVVWSSSQKPID